MNQNGPVVEVAVQTIRRHLAFHYAVKHAEGAEHLTELIFTSPDMTSQDVYILDAETKKRLVGYLTGVVVP